MTAETFPGEYPGSEDVVVDWPDLWRDHDDDHDTGLRADGGSYRWVALTTVLAGLFSSGFVITILGISLKPIARDVHSTTSALTWVVTGPLLALAVAMPLAGKLGDAHGHRRVYLVGMTLFTIVAVPTALAWNAGTLVGFRVIGAVGGAAAGPASMAIIMHAFDERDRVKAMGWWSLVGAGAPVIGLAVGSPIVETIGWRWIFVGQAVVSAIAVAVAFVVLRDTPRQPAHGLDVRGAVTLAGATIALLLGMQRVRTAGIGDALALGLVAAAAAGYALFVRIERRAREPLLPLDIVVRRNVAASLVAQFGANFAYMGSFIITPLLVQDRFGFTVNGTAAAMALRPLSFSLMSPVAGYVATRTGERRTSVLGTALVVVAMMVFAFAAALHAVALVFGGLLLAGLGLGVSAPSLVAVVGNAVDDEQLGVANAAQSMVTQLGVVVGMGIMSTLQAAGDGAAPYVVAYGAGGVAALVGAGAATFVVSLSTR